MTPLLSLQRLGRRYAARPALTGLDLELRRGEVLGLLGPNGAGKSTCLRLIAGTLAPSAGRVLIDGIDPARDPLSAKRLLGYLPERPPLYDEMTVDGYLAYCARLHRLPRRERADAVALARRRCGLDEAGGRLIGHLSDGYRQRIGIAQAIIHQPPLLILDEPTSRLDPNQIREVRDLLRELGRDHAILLSTHILPEVQALCDRVALLHRGRLRLDARLDALDTGPPQLLIGLERPPTPAVLQALPGVDAVETLAPGRFRLQLRPGIPTTTLAERLCAAGWGLRELTPVRRSLEQLFAELTQGEAA